MAPEHGSEASSQGLPVSSSPPTPEGFAPVGTITVEVTHRCHRRCAFCYVPQLGPEDSDRCVELSVDQLARAVGTVMRASGCTNVQLSGGEPLLRKGILQVIEAIRGLGARVSIITDGAQLDATMARALVALGVTAVQPTLLAGSAEVHDAMRGKGAFRDVTRAIATAAAEGLRVSVCMVVTRRNHQEAARVVQLAFALGAAGVALSRFCPAGAAGAAYDSLMPDALQVRSAAQAAADACKAFGLPLAAAVTIPRCVWADPAHPPLRVGLCSLVGPKSTVTLGPDGSVRSCSLSTQSVGNVLDEAWETLSRRLWEQQFAPHHERAPDACQDCQFLPQCLGGCRLSARTVFGNCCEPDPLAPTASKRAGRPGP